MVDVICSVEMFWILHYICLFIIAHVIFKSITAISQDYAQFEG